MIYSQPSPVFSISYLEKVEREIMRILSSFRRDCMIARWRQEKDSRTIMKFLSARQKRLEKGGQKDRNFYSSSSSLTNLRSVVREELRSDWRTTFYRLGDGERRLMQPVPATAGRRMKS